MMGDVVTAVPFVGGQLEAEPGRRQSPWSVGDIAPHSAPTCTDS
jgi:hypothetical protein